MNDSNPKILFIYDMDPEKEKNWRDGLWEALNLLRNNFQITELNLSDRKPTFETHHDFFLGWGGFNSSVDIFMRDLWGKKGLCLGGYGFPPKNIEEYNVIFYETEWSKKWIKENSNSPDLPKLVHAFGVNGNIFNRYGSGLYDIWDYMTVGAFSNWKRQEKLTSKSGTKLAVGEIQKGNLDESMDIVHNLLLHGVTVSDETSPETLVKFYHNSDTVYIPATVFGGGERSVLEARACGCKVEVELDNPKLQELLKSPVWDHTYYAEQLKQGIMSCL